MIIQTLVFLLHVSFEKWQSVLGNWVLKTAVNIDQGSDFGHKT